MAEITANERLEKIANMSLEMMQTRLEKNPGKINAGTLVKDTGEALKTLAEGIESYHRVAKTLKDDSVTKLWGSQAWAKSWWQFWKQDRRSEGAGQWQIANWLVSLRY